MTGYEEDEFLMLSGLQHFVFCRRQWALIHIEQEWEENVLTVEGNYVHESVDNPYTREKRGDTLYVRALPVHSRRLGISGICDMVEFKRSKEGIPLAGESGFFQPKPIEYKRGKPKKHDADLIQLTAQVMCLEEMLGTAIDEAAIFYNEVKRRENVVLTDTLRQQVIDSSEEMHNYYRRRHTPRVKTGKHCLRCSLRHKCLPELLEREKVTSYIDRMLTN